MFMCLVCLVPTLGINCLGKYERCGLFRGGGGRVVLDSEPFDGGVIAFTLLP